MQYFYELNLMRFSFNTIKQATDDFWYKYYLGEGRLGQVYRGYIYENGYARVFAIKRFHMESEITLQNEIHILSSVHHDNIISLVGYCEEEDEMILVYEFMPNGSLHDYLFKNQDQTPRLTVEERLEICIGVAKALTYLHNHTLIVHGTLRDDNILLDQNLVPKISNFELSRNLAGGPSTSPQITSPRGNDGFLAPECYEPNYIPHMKADVYAFGVVLLVSLCDWSKRQVVLTTLPYIMKGELHRFFTEYVGNNSSLRCLRTCESIIRDCLEYNPANRPSMNQVLDKLKLALELQNEQVRYDRIFSRSSKSLSLEDIKMATNDFAMDNLLGEGAFWKSYRGRISGYNGDVSVKRINKSAHGNSIFQNEIVNLDGCNHVNIISLVGYCNEEDEKIIVYKFMANGSLYDYLYDDKHNTPPLTVKQRLDICIGVAQGLSFLHEDIRKTHYNLSTDNIMLDYDLVPRISGIGSMCTQSINRSQLIMDFIKEGNEGYIAPECYKTSYPPSQKTDVYAFGMLLLEVLCEKPPWKSLVILALEFAKKGELPRFRHQPLEINISPECSRACENLIRDCLDVNPDKRPSMKQVVDELGLALTLQKKYQNGRANNQQSSQLNNRSSSSSCQSYLLSDIKRVTNGFSNYLGQGAFGEVYRGNISGDSYTGVVAVKRMTMKPEQGIPAFNKEIELVSACNHINIISLVGFCNEQTEKILIYEFMPNGSLYDYLHKDKDRTARLTIEQRLKICIGVAKGVDYLHSCSDYVIIHSDLKTDNILLDQNLIPKISDFGLSRTRDVGPSTSKRTTYNINGTEGYLAPECYEANYKLSRKADVYAYGVVLLEVLCERTAWDNLVLLALPSIGRGELPNFTPDYVRRHISTRCSRACVHLIRECLDTDPVKRPDMNQIVTKLEEALKLEIKYSKYHQLPFTDPKLFSSRHDRVVLYHTSSGGDATTQKDCREVLQFFDVLRKRVDERDVFLEPLYTDQLQYIFGLWKYSLPQLFIGGNHLGGMDMIRELYWSGELKRLLDGRPDRY